MSASPRLAPAPSPGRSTAGSGVAGDRPASQPDLPAGYAAQPASADSPSGPDLLRGRLMQGSLRSLLDRVAGSRAALPYLAALEGLLVQQGAAAVQGVSQKALAKIHSQLSVLPLDPADGSIQDLVALVRRALRHESTKQTHQLSPFDPLSTVVITEGSETDFMNALHDARRGGH